MSQLPPDDLLVMIESGSAPFADILTLAGETRKKGQIAKVDAALEKWVAQQAEKQDIPAFLQAMGALVEGHAGDRPWKKHMRALLLNIFEADRERKILIESIGFDQPLLRPSDCLNQLRTLFNLKPDALVLDRNFGVGVVRELYPIERKVEVDFETRSGHMMAYTFAAETLELIAPTHLLAQRHLDRAAFEARMKSEPGEMLKDALRSFGNKSALAMQSLFVPRITDEAGWKSFWSAARQKGKNDPHVVIPAKRNEPIQLLEKALEYNDDWFQAFARERDMNRIIQLLQDYLANHPGEVRLSPEQAEIIRGRLAFVLRGAKDNQHDIKVDVLILAGQYNIPRTEIDGVTAFVESVKNPAKFDVVVANLQARDLQYFFEFMITQDPEATIQLILNSLPTFHHTALSEAISLLSEKPHLREEAVADVIRKPWNDWSAEVDVLYWLATHMEKIAEWKLGSTFDLAMRLVRVIDKEYTGDRLRIANQVRELFRDPKWLGHVFNDLDPRQTRALAKAVCDSAAWRKLDHASVKGQMVKLRPELERIISGKKASDGETMSRRKATSIRSYTMRQQHLLKITLKDIPENTRELALARSYGDLRENFEFQTAKENQRTLAKRQSELEKMLRKVTQTTFEGLPAEVAGIGTTVTLHFQDGRQEVFHILGEWDSEPSMHVIPSASALAKALEGQKAGTRLMVPSETGEQEATLMDVQPLPADIIQWANTAIEKLPNESGTGESVPSAS